MPRQHGTQAGIMALSLPLRSTLDRMDRTVQCYWESRLSQREFSRILPDIFRDQPACFSGVGVPIGAVAFVLGAVAGCLATTHILQAQRHRPLPACFDYGAAGLDGQGGGVLAY